jgi:hypothetical protein
MNRILRQIILIVASVFCNQIINAQLVASYTFESSSVSYNPILGGSTLSAGASLDAQQITASIPFSFNFDGANYTSCVISVNGYVSFGGTASSNPNYPIESTSNIIAIAPLSMDLTGIDANSAIKVLSTGVSPNRIFTIEWRNLDIENSGLSSLNFQLKLYQTTNEIRFIYGPCSSSQNSSPQIGLRHTLASNSHIRTNTTGDWLSTNQTSNNLSRIVYNSNSNPPSGFAYTFTPGLPQPCLTPSSQASNLSLTSTISSVSGNFTAGLAHWYLVVRTPNEPLVGLPINGILYDINAQIGNGTVVAKTTSTNFNNFGLVENTYYRYTIFAYNINGCVGGPAYNIINPPTDVKRTLGSSSYTFNPTSGSASYSDPLNWTPVRSVPRNNDTLLFNNGGTVYVTNVSNEIINSLIISNSGNYTFFGSTCYLTLQRLFQIDSGSVLNFSASQSGGITFSGPTTTCQSRINGTLKLNGVTNYIGTAANTIVHGTIEQAGEYCAVVNSNSSPLTNFRFEAGSNYLHSRDGGDIPNANYMSNSNFLLTGIVNTSPYFGTNKDFGNFTFNCVNMITSSSDFLNSIDTIRNTFTILNAFDKSFPITSGTSSYYNNIHIKGDFIQNSGNITTSNYWKIIIDGAAFFNAGSINLNYLVGSSNSITLNGNVNQVFGHSMTGAAGVNMRFSGLNQQTITFNGVIGQTFNYILNNASGIILNNDLIIGNGRYFQLENGGVSGNADLVYNSISSRLYYSGSNQLQITEKEWPLLNGPKSVHFNLTATAPLNRISLTNNRTTDSLTLIQGVLILNDFNLTLNKGAYSTLNPAVNSSNRIVATNGTGELVIKANLNLSAKKSLFYPIGFLADSAVCAYLNFDYYKNDINRFIGIRAIGGNHPANTETNYINKYWKFSDSGVGNVLVYQAQGTYSPSELIGESTNVMPSLWDGTVWQRFAGNIASKVNCDTLNSRNLFLNGSDICAFKRESTSYSWTGAIDEDYQKPQNWNPSRFIPDPTDLLEIATGQIDTINNIPSEYINSLTIRNNSKVVFQSMYNTSSLINYHIDYLERQDSLQLIIEEGSALVLGSSPGSIVLSFGGGKNEIFGTLEVVRNGTTFHQLILENSRTHIKTTGRLKLGGNYDYSIININSSVLIIDGVYEHQFTGNLLIPNCIWGNTATVLINGYTSAYSSTFSSYITNLPKIIYDCPNQTGSVSFLNSMPIITNSFNLVSTGTGQLIWGGNINLTNKIQNFYQSGGNLVISQNSQYARTIDVLEEFSQTGGTISSLSTTGPIPVLKFNGTTNQQNVSFYNSSPAGRYSFQVHNPHGINLSGNDFLTDTFTINTNSELIYSSISNLPIESDLIIKYEDNSSLYYNASIGFTATSFEFPETFGPDHVYANHPSGQVLTIPFSRTISRSLTLNCDVNLNENSLTIGESNAISGDIYGTKSLQLTTGSLTRWFSTTNVPVSANNSKSIFPVMNLGRNRSSSIYFSNSLALTQGGTIQYEHTDLPYIVESLAIQDNANIITSRTQSFWKFSPSNNITSDASTLHIDLSVGNMVIPNDSLDLHVVNDNTVSGTHVTSTGSIPSLVAYRKDLSIEDLVDSEFYIGSPGTMSSYFISIASGDYSNPNIWNLGTVPGINDNAFIGGGTTVNIANTDSINTLGILNYGTLNMNGGNLIVANSLINQGNFQITDGLLRIGVEGGWKSEFINRNIFTSSGGIVEVNGSMLHTTESQIVQSGGSIIIDGNAHNNIENSVPNGRDILSIYTQNIVLSGGIIQIIDPHILASQNANYSLLTNASLTSLPTNVCGPNHTFIFGDGISTDTSTTSFGFRIRQNILYPKFAFDSLIIQGTENTNFRSVTVSNGRLNVLSKLELKGPGSNLLGLFTLQIGGDIILDEGSQFQVNTLAFVDPTIDSSTLPVYRPQTVIASGSFYPNTSATSSFYSISINNLSPEGVRFKIGDFAVTGILRLYNGKMDLDTNMVIANSNNIVYQGSLYNGWVKGKIQYLTIANSGTVVFPIGNDFEKLPIEIKYTSKNSGSNLLAYMNEGDSPNILTSPVLENRSINRNYFINSSVNLSLSADATLRLNWSDLDEDSGLTADNLIAISETDTASWTRNGTELIENNSILISNFSNSLLGNYQLGEPNNIPVIYNQSQIVTVCENSNLDLNVNTGNFFPLNHQWQQLVDGNWVNLTSTDNHPITTLADLSIYSTTTALDSLVFRCQVSTNLDTIYSSPILLKVLPYEPSSNTIESIQGPLICEGSVGQFNLNIENGGDDPFVLWYKNGSLVQYNSTQYLDSLLNNNDTLSCLVLSNAECLINTISESLPFEIVLIEALTPQISIMAENGLDLCEGIESSFNTAIENGGNEPNYSWFKDGILIGSESSITISPQQNDFTLSCLLTSNYSCLSTDTASSENIQINIQNTLTPAVVVSSSMGINICEGTPTEIFANGIHGGNNPIYQWIMNDAEVGTNSPYLTVESFESGDEITCIYTSNANCISESQVSSNTIVLQSIEVVTPSVSISISPSGTLAYGTPVTFTPTLTNCGQSPTYEWIKNGVVVGNYSTYSSQQLHAGDTISLRVYSTIFCTTNQIAYSNSIGMDILSDIQNIHHSSGIFIYPNPSNGIINLNLENYESNGEDFNLTIFSMDGKLIYSKNLGDLDSHITSIDLRNVLSNGIYLLRYNSNTSSGVVRLVVSK